MFSLKNFFLELKRNKIYTTRILSESEWEFHKLTEEIFWIQCPNWTSIVFVSCYKIYTDVRIIKTLFQTKIHNITEISKHKSLDAHCTVLPKYHLCFENVDQMYTKVVIFLAKWIKLALNVCIFLFLLYIIL